MKNAAHNKLDWNQDGAKLFIDNEQIPGANLVDLLHHLLKVRPPKTPPLGFKSFQKVVSALLIPTTWIPNTKARKDIEKLRQLGTPFPLRQQQQLNQSGDFQSVEEDERYATTTSMMNIDDDGNDDDDDEIHDNGSMVNNVSFSGRRRPVFKNIKRKRGTPLRYSPTKRSRRHIGNKINWADILQK